MSTRSSNAIAGGSFILQVHSFEESDLRINPFHEVLSVLWSQMEFPLNYHHNYCIKVRTDNRPIRPKLFITTTWTQKVHWTRGSSFVSGSIHEYWRISLICSLGVEPQSSLISYLGQGSAPVHGRKRRWKHFLKPNHNLVLPWARRRTSVGRKRRAWEAQRVLLVGSAEWPFCHRTAKSSNKLWGKYPSCCCTCIGGFGALQSRTSFPKRPLGLLGKTTAHHKNEPFVPSPSLTESIMSKVPHHLMFRNSIPKNDFVHWCQSLRYDLNFGTQKTWFRALYGSNWNRLSLLSGVKLKPLGTLDNAKHDRLLKRYGLIVWFDWHFFTLNHRKPERGQ